MESEPNSTRPSAASWIIVAVAWTAVGIPLAWGIFQTLKSAIRMF